MSQLHRRFHRRLPALDGFVDRQHGRRRSQPGVVESSRALARVEADAKSGANLMPAIMQAVKAYASVGEITGVLVGEFGRFREPVRF